MSRLFAGVIIAMLLLGGVLAADAADQSTPDTTATNTTVTIVADTYSATTFVPLVLIAGVVFGAVGLFGRLT